MTLLYFFLVLDDGEFDLKWRPADEKIIVLKRVEILWFCWRIPYAGGFKLHCSDILLTFFDLHAIELCTLAFRDTSFSSFEDDSSAYRKSIEVGKGRESAHIEIIMLDDLSAYKYNYQMQQRASFTRSTYIGQPTRYYRSVKYNVTQATGFHPASTACIDKNFSVTRPNASWRKHSSYSTRKNQTHAEIPSNAEEFQPVELKRSYLQTWEKLLAHPTQQKTPTRVLLPSIIDFEPSCFTSLDPLALPIEHIQQGIIDLTKDLPAPHIEMSQIHHDMIAIRTRLIAELEETEKYGLKEFEKLRRMLRTEKVQSQEISMRFRRQCEELRQSDEDFRADFEGTKPRLDVLQEEIFSCRPFELKRQAALNEQFPQDYF